jgi:arginine/lysine/ornithine decarboxylase
MRDPLGLRADAPLLDAWLTFSEHARAGGVRPFTIPGHKQRRDLVGDVVAGDVPLYAGLDTMKLARGVLADAEERAARFWGADWCRFSVGGSTHGNQALALAVGRPGDEVVVGRTLHRSMLLGLVLAGLRPVWVHPPVDPATGLPGAVAPDAVARALAEHPGAVAVLLGDPSYVGTTGDVAALADVAHAAGAPLVVDAAWGAHFGFHPELPENPLRQGADLVISSTHKLGGSLTQSAMLHLGEGPFAAELEPLVDRAFLLAQSTSASALLLASLDLARETLQTGRARIGASIDAADRLRDEIRRRGRFAVVSDGFGDFADIVDADPLRVSIDVARGGLHGHTVRDVLERDGVSFEIATDSCVVAVLGAGVVPDVDRIVEALHGLEAEPRGDTAARTAAGTGAGTAVGTAAGTPVGAAPEARADASVGTAPEARADASVGAAPEARADASVVALPEPGPLAMLPREAFFAQGEAVPIDEAVGRVSTDALAAYPPGIPNVLPGEVVTAEVVEFLRRIAATPGGYVRGAVDASLATLRVVRASPEHAEQAERVEPAESAEPVERTEPAEPAEPAEPVEPAASAEPVERTAPAELAERAEPAEPVEPAASAESAEPAEPAEPGAARERGGAAGEPELAPRVLVS